MNIKGIDKLNRDIEELRKEINILHKEIIECNKYDNIYRIRDNLEKTDNFFNNSIDRIMGIFTEICLIFLSIGIGITIYSKNYELLSLLIFLVLIFLVGSIIINESQRIKFKRTKEYRNLKNIESMLLSNKTRIKL